ncbi:hypothetical protein Ndes2526A_g00638 [Nannochloris sp. 'desiccata']
MEEPLMPNGAGPSNIQTTSIPSAIGRQNAQVQRPTTALTQTCYNRAQGIKNKATEFSKLFPTTNLLCLVGSSVKHAFWHYEGIRSTAADDEAKSKTSQGRQPSGSAAAAIETVPGDDYLSSYIGAGPLEGLIEEFGDLEGAVAAVVAAEEEATSPARPQGAFRPSRAQLAPATDALGELQPSLGGNAPARVEKPAAVVPGSSAPVQSRAGRISKPSSKAVASADAEIQEPATKRPRTDAAGPKKEKLTTEENEQLKIFVEEAHKEMQSAIESKTYLEKMALLALHMLRKLERLLKRNQMN